VGAERKEGINFKVERATVHCVSIDLIGATEAGLKFTTREFDRFNRQLVEQIKPHLEKLWLADSLLKFTGDGWLLMIHGAEKVPALCCLAIIMANRFQDEMSQLTKIAIDRIPPLRLAICSGQDTYVVLPDGHEDWVGDSARRATRASGYCFPNEILIDEPVRYIVFRDFYVKPADIKQRPPEYQPKRMEEDFPVHVLGEPKPEAAADSEAPEYFVYTLSVIGKTREAEIVAQRVSERLGDEVSKLGIAEMAARQGILRSWNRLMAGLLDYSSAIHMLKGIRDAGLAPDVVTYNILINKAPDYDTAKGWVDAMREEGIQPDVFTYNTLIDKAPDYDEAKAWVDTMRGEGIQPSVVTYATLINKAPDYDTAKVWGDTMRGEGIQPNVVTYNTLIKKAPDHDTAKAWVDMMREEGIQPDVVTYNTLIKKAPDYDTAKVWVDMMREEGVQPNVVTCNTLIKKAPDYDAARVWVDMMREEGVRSNVVTYSTLFSKDLSGKPADEILEWYLAQRYHSEESIQSAIAAYRKIHRIDQALRLVLDYPHLQVARKLIREHEEEALSYFRTISDRDSEHPNAEYALGVAFMELGRELYAQPHLMKALRLANTGPREMVIKEWLRQIDRKLAQKQSVEKS